MLVGNVRRAELVVMAESLPVLCPAQPGVFEFWLADGDDV